MNKQYYLYPIKGISLLGIVFFLILEMSMNGCKTMETVTGIGTSIMGRDSAGLCRVCRPELPHSPQYSG